jgi:hypothetical protein
MFAAEQNVEFAQISAVMKIRPLLMGRGSIKVKGKALSVLN